VKSATLLGDQKGLTVKIPSIAATQAPPLTEYIPIVRITPRQYISDCILSDVLQKMPTISSPN
jgi:hypothetical protein